MQALESFVQRSPHEVRPSLEAVTQAALRYLSYDPNYDDADDMDADGSPGDDEDDDPDDECARCLSLIPSPPNDMPHAGNCEWWSATLFVVSVDRGFRLCSCSASTSWTTVQHLRQVHGRSHASH